MNGTTSQLLSLITFGNHFLKTGQLPENYYPGNNAFKFCNKTNFLYLDSTPEGGPTENEVAAAPAHWFELLKHEGCKGLKAYYHPSENNPDGTPDHKLAGFVGGGGTWLIETIYSSYSDFWAARWEVTLPDDPESNIWSVSYGRTVANTDTIDFCPDPLQVREGLHNVLTDIQSFAQQHQLTNWADIFKEALDILDGNAPANDWHTDQINVEGYDQSTLQLIYAAMSTHVFGGMGSWNDISFETEEDNQRNNDLSFYLYDYMNRALIAGVNSIKIA
ncbi:hypothetical protein MUGA111182_11700 [Mucilaginibacter galii]|uniref:Uncharacterized protein n=1 Tax=Mucilaginibacter galii TaxID=2005073 RepID=A0A917JCV5_9SPHI|nr:hypothetical protein [Mucilaginibacter galii]GGI52125.1 hypothetical protein GCM10011425_33370 [Mucilaginibacter galii]